MEKVVSKENAIKEIQAFVLKYDERSKEDWEIENDFAYLLDAVQDGNVIFGEDLKPKLTLKTPIKNEDGEISVSEINFKTRIKPLDLANIMKGVDIAKNNVEYILRAQSYLIMQPKAMLDKFGKFDYKVIEQLSSVFM